MKLVQLKSLLAVALTSLVSVSVKGADILTVHGSGTTNPSKCYWHIMDKMEARAKLPLHMTYRGIGSSGGQAEFEDPAKITYFGSGDIPIRKDLYDQLSATETILQLPVFVGAVSFFHNVPDTPTLNLTACTLAKIMKREITQWDDEEIKADNPELKVSSGGLPIRVARRIDGSSSTSGITNYLAKACPAVWDETNTGSRVDWPADTLECQGSGGVVNCINTEPGTIGYLDAGHGHNAGFEEVYLENKDGKKLTTIQSRNRDGIAGAANAAALPSAPTEDYSEVSLIWQAGEWTWPISAMTYIYVRQDLSFIQNPQEQALLKAFFQTLYDDSFVQQCVDAYEFAKVEGAALDLAIEALNLLQVSTIATPFEFEDDTELGVATSDYYISSKRKSANEVEIDVLTTQNAQLQEQVNEMDRLLQQTMLQLSQMGGSVSNGGTVLSANEAQAILDDNKSDEDKQDGDIAAALAMSIISIILSLVVLAMLAFKSCGSGSSQKQHDSLETA